MAVLREKDIKARATARARASGLSPDQALRRVARRSAPKYDIFLSQTIQDAEVVLGVYELLTELGFVVFCDWVAAPDVDRAAVTPANAALIRAAMSISDTLLFLETGNADQSLWMCWELGWFDAGNGRLAVLPVLPEGEENYRGREFLGLYPYVSIRGGRLEVVRPSSTNSYGVTVIEAPNSIDFERWRQGKTSLMRPRVF